MTGTPLARTRRIDQWALYLACMGESRTIRDSAARASIHTTTAFRWRHRLLDEARACDTDTLSGWIEIGVATFRYSEKGSRSKSREPRPRAWYVRGDDVNVIIACDRSDVVVTEATGRSPTRRLHSREVARALDGRIDDSAMLLAAEGPFGGVATYAARRRLRCVDTRPRAWRRSPPLAHTWTTYNYRLRLIAWIERFRGVATKYLPNYLMWHRLLDRPQRLAFQNTAIRWPIRE